MLGSRRSRLTTILIIAILAVVVVIIAACGTKTTSGQGAPAAIATTVSPTTPAADLKVSGVIAARGFVAFTAYIGFNGSIDNACQALQGAESSYVKTVTEYEITESDARDGLQDICSQNAGQTVDKAAAANDLLGIIIHQQGYTNGQVCTTTMSDQIAEGAAQAMAKQNHLELSKALFLAQLDRNCGH